MVWDQAVWNGQAVSELITCADVPTDKKFSRTVLFESRIAGLDERPLGVCVVRLPHKGWHCAAQ